MLREERAAKAWLITTLRRENARRFARKQLDLCEVPVDLLHSDTTYDTSTEAFVLRRAIADLNSEYRDPLLLQVLGEFTIDEIAHEMEISRGAATTRLFRARQKLKDAVSGGESTSSEAN